MRNHWIGRGILCSIGVMACVFLCGYAVMLLWNWLIPAIFTGAIAINYCQALGILALSKILFGGWKGRGGCGCGCGGYHGGWRKRWKGKWEGMSEEERTKFRSRCGDWCEPEAKSDTQK